MSFIRDLARKLAENQTFIEHWNLSEFAKDEDGGDGVCVTITYRMTEAEAEMLHVIEEA